MADGFGCDCPENASDPGDLEHVLVGGSWSADPLLHRDGPAGGVSPCGEGHSHLHSCMEAADVSTL